METNFVNLEVSISNELNKLKGLNELNELGKDEMKEINGGARYEFIDGQMIYVGE